MVNTALVGAGGHAQRHREGGLGVVAGVDEDGQESLDFGLGLVVSVQWSHRASGQNLALTVENSILIFISSNIYSPKSQVLC